MRNSPDKEKIVYLLKDLYSENSNYRWCVDLLIFGTFEFENHWGKLPNAFDVILHVEHDTYLKHYSSIEDIAGVIKNDIQKISPLLIGKLKIVPDYDKIEIINSEIRPVYTEWEEINSLQSKLIDLLRKGSDVLDFRNIGNSSRTILEKVANVVFKPEKHTPTDKAIDVSFGKFKNRLHSYIKAELLGKSNEDLRKFAEAAIEMVEKAIDLANTLTHKKGAERTIAEVCVIGTISAIGIVKLVEKK